MKDIPSHVFTSRSLNINDIMGDAPVNYKLYWTDNKKR